MQEEDSDTIWNFDSAIKLLNAFSSPQALRSYGKPLIAAGGQVSDRGLGDFGIVWDFLERPHNIEEEDSSDKITFEVNDVPVAEFDTNQLKGVKWRDEVDGADLEDNVEPATLTASQLRTQKRAERRARARARKEHLSIERNPESETASGTESAEELNSLRRSPDRRSLIADLLGRPLPKEKDSPPTSPSPPKVTHEKAAAKRWPVSNPFLWSAPGIPSPSRRPHILPRDGLIPRERKAALIRALQQTFPDEKKFLKNSGLLEQAFTPLNVSQIGIHIFVDMSNISIGFHDCLKLARGLSRETPVHRVPMNFHNFSLVLERGRPAAKRILSGSDTTPAIRQAKSIGYETNILARVHKAKELTPRQQRNHRLGTTSSGPETSGSEMNTMIGPEKWVEQAVDEILHLKMLESIIDMTKPATIVLATGDAAEAEYSGGFMKMIERALGKGWMVELVSFKLNTSSAYRRREFRSKWGSMFKWIVLDDYAEYLIDEEEEVASNAL